jgi:hypothetical protein
MRAISGFRAALSLDDHGLQACHRLAGRPADWRGVPAREQQIKAAIYEIVRDEEQTEAIFAIIFHQREY